MEQRKQLQRHLSSVTVQVIQNEASPSSRSTPCQANVSVYIAAIDSQLCMLIANAVLVDAALFLYRNIATKLRLSTP